MLILGLGDFNVALVFILTILSSLLCIIYGIINWNRGAEVEPEELQEEQAWEQEEERISEA